MSKIKVVHYINQFFAQIGGEEKADYPANFINASKSSLAFAHRNRY